MNAYNKKDLNLWMLCWYPLKNVFAILWYLRYVRKISSNPKSFNGLLSLTLSSIMFEKYSNTIQSIHVVQFNTPEIFRPYIVVTSESWICNKEVSLTYVCMWALPYKNALTLTFWFSWILSQYHNHLYTYGNLSHYGQRI